MKKRRKKQAVTLIEIMIVILLIGLIGGALAYNMLGSLDEGRAFKTRQNIEKLHDVLMLEYATGSKDLDAVVNDWQEVVKKSPLVSKKHQNDLIMDGWKKTFTVTKQVDGDIVVESDGLRAYDAKKQL